MNKTKLGIPDKVMKEAAKQAEKRKQRIKTFEYEFGFGKYGPFKVEWSLN